MTERRLYDDKRRKRNVFVSIMSWRGISAGAKHFYAEVREGDNYIVCGERLIGSSDDPLCEGRCFGGILETAFNTFDAALDWAMQVIKDEFPPETHKLWDCSGGYITLRELKQAIRHIGPSGS